MIVFQPMTRLRLILLFVVVIATLAAFPAHRQDNVLLREGDESAITLEQRQQALNTLLTAAQQFRNAGESLRAAALMNRAGRLQLRSSLPEQALATYQEASSLPGATSNPTTYIDSLNGISAAQDQLRKCDKAEALLQQAIALSEQHDYVQGKAEALLTLSDCQNSSDHGLALSTAQESLNLWKSRNNKVGMANSSAAIGHYQLAQTNLMEATQSQEAALALWQELNNPPEQAEALINLGFIEYRKGAWQSSMSFLTQARSLIDEESEPFRMGQISSGLGEAFIESGLPETGIVKLQDASHYFRESKSPVAVLVMAWDVGRAHYLLRNYQEALSRLQQALRDAQAIEERPMIAMCNEYLGRTFEAMGDGPNAIRHLQIAFDLYLKVGDPMEAARTQALLGQVYEEQGRISKAREYYERSLETFGRLSDQLNQSATLYALGRLELRKNNLDQAEDYLRRSVEATENIRRVSTSTDLTAAFSATVHERYERYIECLMRKHLAQPARGLDVRAFETSELARARSLTELLRATQTNLVPGLDPQLAEQEKSLRQSLRVKEDYKVALLGKAYKKEELDALENELASLETKYKQVTETIRARYPAYNQISRPSAWGLSQIQEQVIADDQTVLLEYSLGSDQSYVWAVTRDHIKSYELPSQSRINEAAQKVYRLLATGGDAQNENELSQAAQELGQMILLPVAAELDKQRLIIVADGALNYIPFQFLPAPAAGSEPLVASYEVINAPSASTLGQLRLETARRQAPARVLAAFGDPIFASNYAQRKDANTSEPITTLQVPENEPWQHAQRDIEPVGDTVDPAAIQPLFYSRVELANLREVAGPESFVATGFDASREKLAAADLTKYAILHFATHGILDPKRPENSGLFLSMVDRNGQPQNGFVGLQDIYSLHAPVDLVVLSACRTGLGKDVRGEGLIGLTRGFMYAGASSVIASLWKVDDEATAELMKRFYANMLQRRMRPAVALSAAQNSIRNEPQWRSPHYWAAFTLQGEYLHVIKSTPSNIKLTYWKIVFAVTLLTLLAGAIWWFRTHRRTRVA